MCFDSQSSLIAWGISASASWYLYNRNHTYDRWNASFITCFSTIQLLEAGIWADPKLGSGDKSSLNEFLTKMIVVGLTAQPLVQTIGGFVVTRADVLWYLSWVLLGFFLYCVLRVTTAKPGESYSTVGPNGHLQWHTPFGGDSIFPKGYGILYAIGLFVPLLFMKAGAGLVLLAVGIGTAIYSLIRAKGKEFGSMWCFTAVLYSLAAILVG